MTYIALAVVVLLVGIDQLTKYLAVMYVKPHGTVNIISVSGKEWLNFTYTENTGAAFSILKDKQVFLIVLTSVIILGVIILMLTKRIKKTSYIWCFSFIIAGGIGNLIDRIVNNYVVDFIDFRIVKFAIFNFADICAVIGTLLLMFFYIRDEINDSRERKKKADSNDGLPDFTGHIFIPDNMEESEKEISVDTEKSDTIIQAEIRKKEDK